MLAAIVRVKLLSSAKHILHPVTGRELCWTMQAVRMMDAFPERDTFNASQNVAFSLDSHVSHWSHWVTSRAAHQPIRWTQAFDQYHHRHAPARSAQHAAYQAMSANHHQVSSKHFHGESERRSIGKSCSILKWFIFIETNLSVGDRVIVSSGMGSRAGILQYIGETKFAPGNWCGVQLDEPSGKNDGTVDGVQYVLATKFEKKRKNSIFMEKLVFHFRYFNCPPNYGIFVPLAKVSLSPLSRKSRLSRAGSKESLNSIGTMGSITSTNTSRLRMSAQVPLTTTTYHVVYSTY